MVVETSDFSTNEQKEMSTKSSKSSLGDSVVSTRSDVKQPSKTHQKTTKSKSKISNQNNKHSSNDENELIKPIPISIVITTIDGKTQLFFECSSFSTIFDIRTFLLEQPITCYITNYQLEFDGEILNDMSQLIQYPNLVKAHTNKHSPVLFMRREYYDERSAKLHFRRLREILVRPPREIIHSSVPDLERERFERLQSGTKKHFPQNNSLNVNKKPTQNTSQRSQPGQSNEKSNAEEALAVLNLLSGDEPMEALQTEMKDSVVDLKQFPFIEETHPVTKVQCLKNINYSCWNPPNGNRRLRGDLLYVEILTLENQTVHITACLDGWFINRSTNRTFDGRMADKNSSPVGGKIFHSLCDLIKKISPLFETRFNSDLLSGTDLRHPFELLEVQSSLVTPDWLVKDHHNRNVDWNQAEDYQFNSLGINHTSGIASPQRDWNEEIASTRELPRNTFEERATRFKHLQRIHSEFIQAVRDGARQIINGNIPPINSYLDSQRSHVFIFNNIFFSFANDAKDMYSNNVELAIDGDEIAAKMASHDLHGVSLYNSVDSDGLHTLLTAIVDYRGERLIGQSIIPGIFNGEKGSKHIFGSMDNGAKIVNESEEFHLTLSSINKKLHIKSRHIIDANGKKHLLAGSVECKGIVGADGRSYLLDLFRVLPRDPYFKDRPEALFRKELITLYCRMKAIELVNAEKSRNQKNEIDAQSTNESKEKEQLDNSKSIVDSAAQNESKSKDAQADADETAESKRYISVLESISFNTDLLTSALVSDGDDTIKADMEQLENLSQFLIDDCISKLLTSLSLTESIASPDNCVSDSRSFTDLLHSCGINMRYSNLVAQRAAASKLPYIEKIATNEMIIRSCKTIIRRLLKNVGPLNSDGNMTVESGTELNRISTDSWYFGFSLVKILNGLFGSASFGSYSNDELRVSERAVEQFLSARLVEKSMQRLYQKQIEYHNQKSENEKTDDESELQKFAAAEEKLIEQMKKIQSTKILLPNGKPANQDMLSPINLYTILKMMMKQKFNCQLDTAMIDRLKLSTMHNKLLLLRSVCQVTGIQLKCRQYDLSNSSSPSFTIDDLMDLVPVVKFELPRNEECMQLLKSGRALLSQGELETSYRVLQEGLTLVSEVQPNNYQIHSADFFTELGLCVFHASDWHRALDYQMRALVLHQKYSGIDHYQTAQAHLSLALFLHCVGAVKQALFHVKQALYIYRLTSSEESPEIAAALINTAMIEQDNGQLLSALQRAKEALYVNQKAFGEPHYQIGLSQHVVAVAYALIGEYRKALEYEQLSKSTYTNVYGKQHIRSEQCQYWINHFTQLAVKTSKAKRSGLPREKPSMLNIIPPELRQSMRSPLTWISYHSSVALKPRLTYIDFLQLYDLAARSEAFAKSTKLKQTEKSDQEDMTQKQANEQANERNSLNSDSSGSNLSQTSKIKKKKKKLSKTNIETPESDVSQQTTNGS